MRYLFFDIEVANCYRYHPKMCTFGYVLTDEHFRTIKKRDLIMNPEAPFDPRVIKEKMNAYPVNVYQERPSFAGYYESITQLLAYSPQIIAGWSVENDVHFLHYACIRYHKPQLSYLIIDIQKVLMKQLQMKNQISLETACQHFQIPFLSFHKSDDDAKMTMEVCKAICKEQKITLQEMVLLYPEAVLNTDEYAKKEAILEERARMKSIQRKLLSVVREAKKMPPLQSDWIEKEKKYCFSLEIERYRTDELIPMLEYLIRCGATYITQSCDCDIFICLDDCCSRFKAIKNRSVAIMHYTIFKEKMDSESKERQG